MKDDTVSRAMAIEAVENITSSMSICLNEDECHGMKRMQRQAILELANMPSAQIDCSYCIANGGDWECDHIHCHIGQSMPSAQPEQTDCEYCHEDSDGFVRPIEKNSHAWLVRRGRTMKLHISFKGEYRECDVLFCPMCGRSFGNG